MDIAGLIRARRSVRTFDGRAVNPEQLVQLRSFMEKAENPYGIPVEFKLLDAKAQRLTCPVVSGTDLYVAGKVSATPHMEEAFGYSFERLVLFAQSLGIGTVWLGGTMDRAAFERAMELNGGQRMPCASPLGFPAKKMSLKESMMRKAIKADNRIPFETLFFDGGFDAPLTQEKAGILSMPLEMVRWAPSAVNKQPWRIVIKDNAAHFYLMRSKGFGGATIDMQKIDMGIALCHFELAAREAGLAPCFMRAEPPIAAGSGLEYIASYQL